MKKSTLFLLLVLGFVTLMYFDNSSKTVLIGKPIVPSKVNDGSISKIDYIGTDNYANKKLKYFYYIPESIAKSNYRKAPYLIMVPGLSGDGEYFVSKVYKDFANKEGFVIISPSFKEDAKNWESEKSYQYPAAWSGNALNTIINTFSVKQNIVSNGMYLYGISAGAQFVSRYSLLYPDYVTACALNAPGGTDDPQKYQATKFYVGIGTQDEAVRRDTATNFYQKAKRLGIDVTYKEYDVGHALSPQAVTDELAFFSRIKNGN